MLDDPSDELFAGLWPFLKRILFMFLPFWVFLLLWAAKLPTLLASIGAGASVALIIAFERWQLSLVGTESSSEDSLIK